MDAQSVTVYVDPAESSMTLDRPGLTAMRLAIEQGRHNCVIVWDQDRLSRDAVGSLIMRDEILSAGCQLIFLQGGATTASPDDLLLYGIKALMAQSERIKIRART
ncbi:protein containing Resolvase, partial [mine drainage metagenome]